MIGETLEEIVRGRLIAIEMEGFKNKMRATLGR